MGWSQHRYGRSLVLKSFMKSQRFRNLIRFFGSVGPLALYTYRNQYLMNNVTALIQDDGGQQTSSVDSSFVVVDLDMEQLKAENMSLKSMQELKARLEEKEKTEAQGNLEEVNRLHHEQVETNNKHAEDIRRLQSELKQKNEQHAKEMTQMKTEFEHRFREAEKLRDVEVQRKVSRQDVAARGRLRELRNEIEALKKDSVEKDNTINELSEQLNKAREECDQKEHAKKKCVEVIKSNSERIQHELKQRHLAEASRRQKEHDKQLKDKDTEIKTLTEQLQIATVREFTVSEAKHIA